MVIAGCGGVTSAADATPIDSPAAPDAAGSCDPLGAFDAPMLLEGFDTGGLENSARLTPDERTIYFAGILGADTKRELYVARRSTVDEAFGSPTLVNVSDAAAEDYDPTISADDRLLMFSSDRDGVAVRLYAATRSTALVDFDPAAPAAGVGSPTATDSDHDPFITADGQELWFASNRTGGLVGNDIWRATWVGSSFANAEVVLAVSSSSDDAQPVLSADLLTIYLRSDRPGTGTQGGGDIWVAHRSTTSDGFPPPEIVDNINTPADDAPSWLSPDNCRLYLHSTVAGSFDIYVAQRQP